MKKDWQWGDEQGMIESMTRTYGRTQMTSFL